jgi:hypothetical protein
MNLKGLLVVLGFFVCGSFQPTEAATVTWNFNTATGNLGTTETYTAGGITISAAGYGRFFTPVDLYGKNSSGDEKGLGIKSGSDHEISGFDFVRIDFSNARAAGVTGFMFKMDSATNGEDWEVFGSNKPNTNLTRLLVGSDESLHPLSGAAGTYDYYYFKVDNPFSCDNVLLNSVEGITAAVPEASTWAMLILGFVSVGFLGYRQRTYRAIRVR